jgi:hypothetical protein
MQEVHWQDLVSGQKYQIRGIAGKPTAGISEWGIFDEIYDDSDDFKFARFGEHPNQVLYQVKPVQHYVFFRKNPNGGVRREAPVISRSRASKNRTATRKNRRSRKTTRRRH